jgi:diguanylate cyclase (GGDEF)-like protein
VKQKSIDFRELLEHLLPLDQLPPPDRLRVHRALATGVGETIEAAAMTALGQLERGGSLTRLPADPAQPGRVRYRRAGELDVISLQVPGVQVHEGFLLYPRSMLPSQAHAGVDQVRRLLRLDDPSALSDPRNADARHALIEQLDQAGREFMGAHSVRLVLGTDSAAATGGAASHALLAEARLHAGSILYSPDVRDGADGVRSAAITAVSSSDGQPLGTLEVTSRERDAFRLEDLSMMALLADYCGSALERVDRIETLVFVDPLTQVYNRSYFDLQVQNEMARAQREQNSLALVIADIDDFKSFNTAFGYEAGNQVLSQVAQALKRGVRPFDTVSRWGGEEFSILLTAPVQAEDVATACERLRSIVERMPVHIEGLDRRAHRLGVTVSIGVALYPDHAETAGDLWRAANQALLKAKRGDKNQVVFFVPESGEESSAG